MYVKGMYVCLGKHTYLENKRYVCMSGETYIPRKYRYVCMLKVCMCVWGNIKFLEMYVWGNIHT